MAKSHRRGAAAERRIAHELGGARTGNTGKATADVTAGLLVVEVKERATLPAWLKAAIGQAVTAAAGSEKIPLAILHEGGQPYREALVLMRLGDFQAWLGSNKSTESTVSSPK